MSDLPRIGRIVDGTHRYPLRVFYEDTDAAGVVYYANYLKFAERARSEMLRLIGVEHQALRDGDGVLFMVRRAAADYIAPARLGDELVVETRITEAGGARLELEQHVTRAGETLVRLSILVACVDRNGRAVRLPSGVRAALDSFNDKSRMVNAHG
jgi:acyl-CoA thioester hydrolase